MCVSPGLTDHLRHPQQWGREESMKRIMALTFLALLLAGCGPLASPSHYEYDSHAVTTTTTVMQTAAQEQSGNIQTCIGLIVLDSCNSPQSNIQTTAAPARQVTAAPASGENLTLADVGLWFLIAAMCSALFCALIAGIQWIFRDEYADAN